MKPGLGIGPCRRFDTVEYFVSAFSFFSSKIFFLSPVFSCSSSCLQGPKTLFVFRLHSAFLHFYLHQNYLQRILVLNFEATLKLFLREMVIGSFNPYWEILENSSRTFSEISVFRGVTQMDFWKIHPSIFVSTYSVFVQDLRHELDRFLENSSIFGLNLGFNQTVLLENSSKKKHVMSN